MNAIAKRIFIHDTVINPLGQRGVDRCYNAYVKALIDAYPGKVTIYSARPTKVNGARIISQPSVRVKPGKVHKKIAQYDNSWGATIANLSSQVYYSPFYGFMRTKIPQVFTALDLIHEKMPQYYPSSLVQSHIREKRECFERASLIISISRNTANDILDIYPHIVESKLKVVYLGVDDLFFQSSTPQTKSKPYFLFVGNRGYYKNFLRFIDAYGRSGIGKNFDLRVISPIQDDLTQKEIEIIRRYRLEDYIKMEYQLSDEELKERYSGAYAFVYPTEYEGFGLPIIEALASGTLVLTSNTSSLPEVGGPAPLYFDPLSAESMVDVLQFASKMTGSARQEHILAGKDWAKQFTWQNSQRSFVTAIQTLLVHNS